MTLSSEIGLLEDKVADLTTRLSQCENALAFERGKNEQLEQINIKLQSTIAVRETALALHEAGARTNAVEPMQLPEPTQIPYDPTAANEVAEIRAALNASGSTEAFPKFIQNAQIPKVADKRRSAA